MDIGHVIQCNDKIRGFTLRMTSNDRDQYNQEKHDK